MADKHPSTTTFADDTGPKKVTSETQELPCTGEFASDYAALKQFKELIRITKTICERELSSREGIPEDPVPAESEMRFLFDSNTFAEDLTRRANCT